MRILALLLLVANVLFFTWRFNAQLEDDLAARHRAPPLPANAPGLTLLRELPQLPPEREPEEEELIAGLAPAEGDASTSLATRAAPGTEIPATIDTPAGSTDGPGAGSGAPTAAPGEAANASPSTPPTAAPAGEEPAGGTDSAPAPVAPVASNGPDSASMAKDASAESVATGAAQASADASAVTTSDSAGKPAPVAAVEGGAAGAGSPLATAAKTTTPAASATTELAQSVGKSAQAQRVPSGVCLRAGPFARDADAARLKAWLSARSAHLVSRQEGASQKPLFGIYLEPRSANEKEENLRDLARRGVRDYLPVQRSGMAHAISLGVFSTQENVNRRLAEIERQGYRPIVVPRRDAGGQRFVEAELAVGFEDPSRVPQDLLGSAKVQPVACKH